jgi:hypothetical protein
MDGGLRRIAALALLFWVGRWAARELTSYAGQRWLPRGPAPRDSPRRPGLMPGPFA